MAVQIYPDEPTVGHRLVAPPFGGSRLRAGFASLWIISCLSVTLHHWDRVFRGLIYSSGSPELVNHSLRGVALTIRASISTALTQNMYHQR